METNPSRCTELLARHTLARTAERSELFQIIYDELRGRAHALLARHARDPVLQTTALIHDAWLKLGNGMDRGSLEGTAYLRIASSAMRSILIDHARARATRKRGEGRDQVDITIAEAGASFPGSDLFDIDSALERLSAQDAPAGEVAELRLYGGLENTEIARILTLSTRTVERHWRYAKAWLQKALREDG